jgi:uncharacterized protein (TIGR03083 family)
VEKPRDKAELLARIERSWGELDQLVRDTDAARLTAPGPDGGWSVKDHLAHLAVWEGRLLAFVEGRTMADYFGVSREEIRQIGTDGLNAIVDRRNRGRPLREVLAEWRAVHARLVPVLAGLDLARPVASPDNPSEVAPLLGSGVLDGNTYEHYEEHLGWIKEILAAR